MKAKQSNRLIVVMIGLTALILIAVALIVIVKSTNNLSYATAYKSVDILTSSLQKQVSESTYLSEIDSECLAESFFVKHCTLRRSLLLAEPEIDKNNFVKYFEQNGFYKEGSGSYFDVISEKNYVISRQAHVVRPNNFSLGKDYPVTERISVFESKQLPEPDGEMFANTTFSYKDNDAYNQAKQNGADRYYIVTVATEYKRSLW